jgi:hypothetical protein
MAKIPYLIRRKNVFYFRLGVPAELRGIIQSREIIQSLRTQNSDEAQRKSLILAAHFKTLLHELKTGRADTFSRVDLLNPHIKTTEQDKGIQQQAVAMPSPFNQTVFSTVGQIPLLSVVVEDFLNRYDRNNKATYTKLIATLPLLVELVGDKPVNQILQLDLNEYFDDVQKLPVKRTQKIFQGMTIREIIAANNGRCIAEGTFESTYKACVSIFLSWAMVNYKDQGFPSLSLLQNYLSTAENDLTVSHNRLIF